MINPFDKINDDIAWCQGCGNFLILDILKTAMFELEFSPQSTVLVSGIGQAAKIPQYINANFFNGLHGRALPVATGIKLANKELNVIVSSGDGDMYGEGGNHFVHTIRRNPNITVIVHDNMVYGLTKGQSSPTSFADFSTKYQKEGTEIEPFNPLAIALSLNASFVARAFCQDKKEAVDIVKKAVLHRGMSIIDMFQPCVIYNKLNTYKWFKDNTYYLSQDYVPNNRAKAFELALKTDKYPLGIFYENERAVFEENHNNMSKTQVPLYLQKENLQRNNKIKEVMQSFV